MKNKTKSRKSKKWSIKERRSINCKHPRGFSERQYCKRQSRGKYKFTENKIALKSIKKSDRTNKKYKATLRNHKNGKKERKDYLFRISKSKDPKNDYTRHKDKNRRNRYIWRHMKDTRSS